MKPVEARNTMIKLVHRGQVQVQLIVRDLLQDEHLTPKELDNFYIVLIH